MFLRIQKLVKGFRICQCSDPEECDLISVMHCDAFAQIRPEKALHTEVVFPNQETSLLLALLRVSLLITSGGTKYPGTSLCSFMLIRTE